MQSVKSNFEDVDLGDSQETTQSNFEDVDLEDSHETTQTNNNQGEYILDQHCFLMLHHHPFDFEFSYVVQFL